MRGPCARPRAVSRTAFAPVAVVAAGARTRTTSHPLLPVRAGHSRPARSREDCKRYASRVQTTPGMDLALRVRVCHTGGVIGGAERKSR